MKNIIITGSSKGIGLALAKIFAAKNVRLLLCARSTETLQEAAASILLLEDAGEVVYKPADLSAAAGAAEFATWCNQYGPADILINNAGSFVQGNLTDEAEGNLQQMLDTNLQSAYHLTRAVLPFMIEAGTGHIINISSIAALQAYEGGGSYSISKAALTAFSKNLRHELKGKNIKVTVVHPGAVFTDSWQGFDNSAGRIMETEDIAIMVKAATLLSPQAVVEEIVIRPQLGDL